MKNLLIEKSVDGRKRKHLILSLDLEHG